MYYVENPQFDDDWPVYGATTGLTYQASDRVNLSLSISNDYVRKLDEDFRISYSLEMNTNDSLLESAVYDIGLNLGYQSNRQWHIWTGLQQSYIDKLDVYAPPSISVGFKHYWDIANK